MKAHLQSSSALRADYHRTSHKHNYPTMDLNPYLLLKEAPFVRCYLHNLVEATNHQMVEISYV
jgi:hypothetical protein